MKKSIFIILTSLFSVIFISCEKEDVLNEIEDTPQVLLRVPGPDTNDSDVSVIRNDDGSGNDRTTTTIIFSGSTIGSKVNFATVSFMVYYNTSVHSYPFVADIKIQSDRMYKYVLVKQGTKNVCYANGEIESFDAFVILDRYRKLQNPFDPKQDYYQYLETITRTAKFRHNHMLPKF
jgi:hypothetical protein